MYKAGSGWFTCDVLFCYDHRGAGGLFACFFDFGWIPGFFLLIIPSLDRRSWVSFCWFVCMKFRQDTNWVVSFLLSYVLFLFFCESVPREKFAAGILFSNSSLWPWHDMKEICQSLIFLIYTYCLIHGLCAYNWLTHITEVVLHRYRMIHCRMIVWSTPSRNTPETRKGFDSTADSWQATGPRPVGDGAGSETWNLHASWHLGLVFWCVGLGMRGLQMYAF